MLQAAGINSVYYELGGGLWHSIACERFPTKQLLYDLTHISKGQKFANVPQGVVHLTPAQSLEASLDGHNGQNDYYVQLAI
jgi:hypothetical protein